MPQTAVTVVDTLARLVQNGTYDLWVTIKKDGATYNLTGLTVTATIRAKRQPGVVLHSTYENMTVSLGNTEVTAANGGVTLADFSPSSTYFWAPSNADEVEFYYIQFYVQDDDFYPQLLQFGVRRQLD